MLLVKYYQISTIEILLKHHSSSSAVIINSIFLTANDFLKIGRYPSTALNFDPTEMLLWCQWSTCKDLSHLSLSISIIHIPKIAADTLKSW